MDDTELAQPGNSPAELRVPMGTPAEFGLPEDCSPRQNALWEKQERYLKAYEEAGHHTGADRISSVHWSTREYWIEQNLYGFRDRLKAAQHAHTARWESHMDKRLEEPQGNRGSDILLMFKLKALAPEKYRETVNIADSGNIMAVLRALGSLGAMSMGPKAGQVADAQVRELPAGEAPGTGSEVT